MARVFGNPRLLRTFTTLDPREFARLEAAFGAAWQEGRRAQTHEGRERRRQPGGGYKGKLPDARAKLFFVLFYFKCYPLQEVMGLLFGLSQGQVSARARLLTPLVNAALGRELLLPARRPADLEGLLQEVPALRSILDGTERPVRRPQDPDRQRADYSGKKKGHRKKNLLVAGGGRVLYVGPTAPGSVHDKKLADEAGLAFPPGSLLIKDSGFQGYEPPGVETLQPMKKPRGRELHPLHKQINRLSSQARIPVEHAIAGVKRCRIVLDTFRNWAEGLADEVMLAACGLHNLRAATRQAAAA